MTTLLVVLLVGGTVATLAVLAVALVLATDRLRATVERVLAVRDVVEPELTRLRTEAARARTHAERLRATPLRGGDRPVVDGPVAGTGRTDGVPPGAPAR